MGCELFTRAGLRCPKPVLYGGVLFLAALFVAFGALAPRWRTAIIPTGANASASSVLLNDLNEHRREKGLRPLAMEPVLGVVAREHADDMVVRNYFNHVSPTGVTPFARMREARVHYVWAGENIAESDIPAEAAQALWQSPEHRANILNPHYRHVGISTRERPDGALVFVEEFTN